MSDQHAEHGGASCPAEPTDDYDSEEVDTSHLDDLDDGCGCAEVWDHLSEHRGSD